MIYSLKIVSVLLSYPSSDFAEAVPDIKNVLSSDSSIGDHEKKLLVQLAENIAQLDLYDAQERYVFLFDRTRSLSLHLFEHVHGESRDRGQAMVDLMSMYEKDGFEIDTRELPDYLPLFLEYLSQKPLNEAVPLIGQTQHILEALKEKLQKRESIYANAFMVLESLSKAKSDKKLLDEILNKPDFDPNDLTALDQVWEEEVVTFGGNAGENSCGPDRLRTQLRAFTRNQKNPTNELQN